MIQDARRRKLDSGRVDAEAVIDELMEVKKKTQRFSTICKTRSGVIGLYFSEY